MSYTTVQFKAFDYLIPHWKKSSELFLPRA